MKYAIGGLTRFSENPSIFKTMDYSVNQKTAILDYMESFNPDSVAGYIDDCKTGKRVNQTNAGYNDGEFYWSDQDVYHVRKYNAAVSDEFIDHVMLNKEYSRV